MATDSSVLAWRIPGTAEPCGLLSGCCLWGRRIRWLKQLSNSSPLYSPKTITLTRWTFLDKVMSLLFNMLSRLVIAFLPRSKRLLISWLQSPSAVILEPRKINCSHYFLIYFHEVIGPDAMILVFWMLSFKPTFSLSSFTFIKRLFSSPSLSVIRVVSSAYLRLLIFLPEILIPACASSSTFNEKERITGLSEQSLNWVPRLLQPLVDKSNHYF